MVIFDQFCLVVAKRQQHGFGPLELKLLSVDDDFQLLQAMRIMRAGDVDVDDVVGGVGGCSGPGEGGQHQQDSKCDLLHGTPYFYSMRSRRVDLPHQYALAHR